MRTYLLVAAGIPTALATKICVQPPLAKLKLGPAGAETLWSWQLPYAAEDPKPEPTTCAARIKEDTYSPSECQQKCKGLESTAGITDAKILCMDTATSYTTHNELTKGLQAANIIGSSAFAWTSMEKGGAGWSGTTCTAQIWSAQGENSNQYDWDQGGAAETATDAAVWVLGNEWPTWPGGLELGSTPFLAGVTAGASDPEDIFCFCQWEPYDPLACESSQFGCCDGNDVTAARADMFGTNCVGGAAYTNDKEVEKAINDVVAAAVGLGTGILVAVIVGPIVGLILLIVCIVCICKHCCGNNKPSA